MKVHVPQKKEKGFTLFYALLVTSLLLALGLAVFNITLKELLLSSDARESRSAFYAADAALECALYWDRGDTPAFGFYGNSLASGLRGYWAMEEEADDTFAYDYSGHNTHGTLTNLDGNGLSWGSGRFGDALTFDGVDDKVVLSSGVGLSGEFTISLWVRPVFEFPPSGTSVKFVMGGPFKFGFRLNALGTVDYRLAMGVQYHEPMGDDVLNDGNWHNLVLRRDATNAVELFVDGNTSSPIQFGTIETNTSFSVFGFQGGDVSFYKGSLDDVRVYNRALNEPEIKALVDGVSNNVFVDPVVKDSDSGVWCAGEDMSMTVSGWDPDNGWDIQLPAENSAITTFDIRFPETNRCAFVEVAKDTSTTTIISRGYNTCEEGSSRRVERALRAEY